MTGANTYAIMPTLAARVANLGEAQLRAALRERGMDESDIQRCIEKQELVDLVRSAVEEID